MTIASVSTADGMIKSDKGHWPWELRIDQGLD